MSCHVRTENVSMNFFSPRMQSLDFSQGPTVNNRYVVDVRVVVVVARQTTVSHKL